MLELLMVKFKIKPLHFVTVLLFVLIIILRFWKATDWFSFNHDEEYQAFLAWSQVKDFHPIWIGVSSSNFGFYLGPAFTYLNALLFAISKGDLAILSIFSPALGILTIVSIYVVISQIFSQKAAIYSSLIYGLSPLLNLFDRRFWNPTPVPFLTIWFLFSIYKSQKDTRWFILTAAIMSTALHIHLSLVVLWPLIIFWLFKNFKKIKISTWILSVLVYCLIVSPLIVFDLVHNFDDLLGPIRYFLSPTKSQTVIGFSAIIGHSVALWQSLGRLLYLGQGSTVQDEMMLQTYRGLTRPHFLISLIFVIPLIWIVVKSKIDKKYVLLLISALSVTGAYLIYPASNCEYFLVSFFTLYTIIIGIFLSKIPQLIAYISIIVMAIFASLAIFTNLQSQYGLGIRKELIKEIQIKTSGQEIYVTARNKDGEFYFPQAGWCYLIRSMGTIPDSCPADQAFAWIYSTEVRGNKPKFHVIISDDPKYLLASTSSQLIKKGAYSAEIIPLK